MPQAEADPIAGGAIGPVRLPKIAGEPLDHNRLQAIARLQVVLQISQPAQERFAIIAREQDGLGRHAVLERVEPRLCLSLIGLWSGAFLRIAAIGLSLCGRSGSSWISAFVLVADLVAMRT